MSGKSSFLLSHAKSVLASNHEVWVYDDELCLNMIDSDEGFIPACSSPNIVTQSKTDSAPGDDDPDTDADFIY